MRSRAWNFPATVYPRPRASDLSLRTSGPAVDRSVCITIAQMTPSLGRWLRDPLFLVCLTAGLRAFVVQSGELGTFDTTMRLQTTHWLWTSSPPVLPGDYPDYGLHGRGGRLYGWFGIG